MSSEGTSGQPIDVLRKQQRRSAGKEFLVKALLADLDVPAGLADRLLIPKFPQARRTFRLQAAHQLQRA